MNDVNLFEAPQLRGISRTAPYFHDNSAATLKDAVLHYNRFFEARARELLTPQEVSALVAYLKVI